MHPCQLVLQVSDPLIFKKLVANELLDVPVGMDTEDYLPCGCEWKLVAVELLVKHRANALAVYDHNNNVVGNNLVST
jgi:hypothetical protein